MINVDIINRDLLEQVKRGVISKGIALEVLKKINGEYQSKEIMDILNELAYEFPSIVCLEYFQRQSYNLNFEGRAFAALPNEKNVFLKIISNGLMGSNCYLIGCNGVGVIIDPGSHFLKIKKIIESLNVSIKYIIITHGHIDHMLSMDQIREFTGARIVMHELDKEALRSTVYNGSVFLSDKHVFKKVDQYVKEGDILEGGGLQYEIIHTPGHTKGSICIKVENKLFTGDIFFKKNIGKIGYVSGNEAELYHSYHRILSFDDSYIVYPGHGEFTTIKEEKLKRNV
ncbi:MBL fold metallo-hydrolase [Bacillus cereus group sp. N34]|uniref:MBL fold metallo-hydrolase n=1 Tax=Bacillus cereus group sp. N34 TaxID=2794595 RepID=UPI0018F298B8|nr:MBL fold metallo-hydrolase [Bacillus cereus group sp. N34]MBJ8015087.1 MBL fold metallo-hydrolase [Bacillus cereus group sp. N34]